MQRNRTFRPATIDDATVLAELVNYAGEGMPLYLWGQMAEPGEAAWDVGRRRAAREEGSFSYCNATIIEHDNQCAGCLIGYEIPENPEPIPDDMPSMFVPLQELENHASGTWYINELAVRRQFRRQRLGTKLLALANETAEALGTRWE
jgi:ribosomal protein S18 acetylase RimI-like enzyme